jgi:predicted chitinase
MGQVFVETVGFTVLEENLNYRDPELVAPFVWPG